jgi:hypothetical protein
VNPGDRVRYVPGHADGDPRHPDCEDGTVSSLGETCVRVRFDKHVARLGWDGATAQACTPGDLIDLPLTEKGNAMSGGSFDYAYSRTAQFADELENRLDTDSVDDGPSPAAVARLRRLVADARRVSELMKEAEWLYSGDTGEDTFLKRAAEIDERGDA